jgi:hypothetical protein
MNGYKQIKAELLTALNNLLKEIKVINTALITMRSLRPIIFFRHTFWEKTLILISEPLFLDKLLPEFLLEDYYV